MADSPNTESKKNWVAILAGVGTVVLAALQALLASDLIPKEHTAYLILGGLATVLGSVLGYTVMRPAKTNAVANKLNAEAALELAKKAVPVEKDPS